MQNSGQPFPIKPLSASFPIRGSIKLGIINMAKLSTEVLAQTATKNTKSIFTKSGRLFIFRKNGFRSGCPGKF